MFIESPFAGYIFEVFFCLVVLFYITKWLLRFIHQKLNPLIPVGVLSELYLYPISSGKGIPVPAMECGIRGGNYGQLEDRQFMVIRADTHRSLTAASHPHMVLLEAAINDGILLLSYASREYIKISLHDVIKRNTIVVARMYAYSMQTGWDCGDEVGEWLKKVLNEDIPLRLLYYRDDWTGERFCVKKLDEAKSGLPIEKVRFNAVAPFMAFSDGSLADLNAHFNPAEKYFVSRNFRPNIVIGHCAPYSEDWWMELHIGTVIFQCYKPCARCIMVATNPLTGERDLDFEPLFKLRTYRLAPEGKLRKQYKDDPLFGVYMKVEKAGKIQVGDSVYARLKRHPF